MFNVRFAGIRDEKELMSIQAFMLEQPQFYPKHEEWVMGKCSDRIEWGQYETLVAFSSYGLNEKVIGCAVYHCLSDHIVEVKHLRIDTLYRNRDLGHFLLTQVEIESQAREIRLDVSVENFVAVEFYIRNRFKIEGIEVLYQEGQLEYLLCKKVPQRDLSHFSTLQ